MLYGSTWTDVLGDPEGGTVFRLNKDGSDYAVLHYFYQNEDESFWPLGIVEGSDGVLYGTTYWGGSNSSSAGSVFKLNKDGSGFRVLHDFAGYQPNGAIPAGKLVEGRDGLLYGMVRVGGPGNGGTVFSLQKDGSDLKVVHRFTAEGNGGRYPYFRLLLGDDGTAAERRTRHIAGQQRRDHVRDAWRCDVCARARRPYRRRTALVPRRYDSRTFSRTVY